MKNNIILFASLLFLAFYLFLPKHSSAQDGTLDITFDSDGIVTTPIGGDNELCYSITIQSDSKIVAGGCSFNGVDLDFALVRYNNNGSLDNTFGSGGKVTTAITIYNERIYSIAILRRWKNHSCRIL